MEEELNAQDQRNAEARMSEVEKELSQTALDAKSDDLAIDEK